MTIAYRPAEIDDARFVVSQWSRCYKASPQAGMIADEDWPRIMHEQIQKLLNRPDVTTITAYENTDPTFIYGFMSATIAPVPVVHFIVVKEAFRRAGYARGLFAAMGIDPRARFIYTCYTEVIQKLKDQIPLAEQNAKYARITGYVEEPRRADRWKR